MLGYFVIAFIFHIIIKRRSLRQFLNNIVIISIYLVILQAYERFYEKTPKKQDIKRELAGGFLLAFFNKNEGIDENKIFYFASYFTVIFTFYKYWQINEQRQNSQNAKFYDNIGLNLKEIILFIKNHIFLQY